MNKRSSREILAAAAAVLVLTTWSILAGCSQPEAVDEPDTAAGDSQTQPETPTDAEITPAEYARRSDPLEWSGYTVQEEPQWERSLVHIGSHPPLVIESEDALLLVLHTVAGAVALDGFSGEQLWTFPGEIIQVLATTDYTLELLKTSGFLITLDPLNGEQLAREFVGRAVVAPAGEAETETAEDSADPADPAQNAPKDASDDAPEDAASPPAETPPPEPQPTDNRQTDTPPAAERDLTVTAAYRPYAFSYCLESLAGFMADKSPEGAAAGEDAAAGEEGNVEAGDAGPEAEGSDGGVELIEGARAELTVADPAEPLRFAVSTAGRYEIYKLDFETEPLLFSIREPGFGSIAENQDYGGMTDSVTLDLGADTVYELQLQLLPDSDPEAAPVFRVQRLSEG